MTLPSMLERAATFVSCKKALTGKIETFDGSWSSRPSRGWGQTQAGQLLLMQKDGGGPLAHRRYDGSTRVKKGGDRLLNAQLHRGVICHTCHCSHLHICVCSRGSKPPHRKTPYCKRHMCTHERMQVSAAHGGMCAWMWLEALAATAGSALPPPPHGPPLGQTPSALINVAINQAGADIGVISPQCSPPERWEGTLR